MNTRFLSASLIVCGIQAFLATATPGTPPASPLFAPSLAAPQEVRSLAGTWSGAVKLPGMELRIEVTLARNGNAWTGTIDIPQQGARGLPLEAINIEDDAASFQIAGIPGSPTFSGKLDAEGRLTGNFAQGPQSFPFELARGSLAKAKRPQNPVPPFPYSEQELTAANGSVTLAGTLTLPQGDGPFPAVILVSGSGAQNRDEEIFEHRPFAVWADHLSRNGVAVLRYDDRGVGASTGDFATATTTMLAADAEAWINVLTSRPDIRSVGMMGHSEGGIIAPMVAARNPGVAFVVMLSGTGVTGAEVLIEQNRSLALAAGADAEAADAIAAAAREVFAAIAAKAPQEELRAKMVELARVQTAKAEADADVQRVASQALSGLSSPWFTEFIAHDPAADLRKVRVPVLALFGERDVQVVPAQNRPPVEAALKEGANTRATVEVIPGVNHLFQKCTTGGVEEYERIETTVEPTVLELVSRWILSNAGTP